MLIKDLSTAGAMPATEMMMRFAGQRQRILAHNIANIDTPNFQTKDVDPKAFQKLLSDAIDERRTKTGGAFGDLNWSPTRDIKRVGNRGELKLIPGVHNDGGILHHDRNNADLERLMQDMVENATVYRVAADLLRSQKAQLHGAISQRVY